MKVSQKKLDRLWMHLLKVEELTGGKLREEPDSPDSPSTCPIINFSPRKDKHGYKPSNSLGGKLSYHSKNYQKEIAYKIHDGSDTNWWMNLTRETKEEITNWVIEKIKERNGNNG